MKRPFQKTYSKSADVMALQGHLEKALVPTLAVPLLDGRLFRDVVLTTAGLQVEHGLGRAPLGWLLIDNTADARVWRTAWNAYTLDLDASASTTVSLWIF